MNPGCGKREGDFSGAGMAAAPASAPLPSSPPKSKLIFRLGQGLVSETAH
jgi:hypothetical protein